ncbi:protein of unknown function [Rhodovastum atsumiense]|nr:protein of unknown function [Rhodovastum atsumiense]
MVQVPATASRPPADRHPPVSGQRNQPPDGLPAACPHLWSGPLPSRKKPLAPQGGCAYVRSPRSNARASGPRVTQRRQAFWQGILVPVSGVMSLPLFAGSFDRFAIYAHRLDRWALHQREARCDDAQDRPIPC